jgi:hypothetical protein
VRIHRHKSNAKAVNTTLRNLLAMTSPRVPSCRFGFLAASALAIILALLPGSAAFAQGCAPLPPYAVDSDRIGMNVVVDQGKGVFDYDSDYLGAGWFLDYRLTPYTGSASASTTASFSF